MDRSLKQWLLRDLSTHQFSLRREDHFDAGVRRQWGQAARDPDSQSGDTGKGLKG
jgi:hypothetical protein